MQEQNISDGKRRNKNRKIHNGCNPNPASATRQHNLSTTEKDTSPSGAVRPYLLTKIRSRKSKAVRQFTPQMKKQLYLCIKNFCKENQRKIPSASIVEIDENFFENIGEIFCEDCLFYLEYTSSIILHNGQVGISYMDTIPEDSFQLVIGGAQQIKNEKLRFLTECFLLAFIDKNPFRTISNTVHCPHYESVLQCYEQDNRYVLDRYADYYESPIEDFISDIENALDDCSLTDEYVNHLRKMPFLSKDELLDLIKQVNPQNELERQLLDILEEGLPFIFEQNWDEKDIPDYDDYSENFSNCGCLLPTDLFTVTMSPFDSIGLTYIGSYLLGYDDCVIIPPPIFNVAFPDHIEKDIDKRFELSKITNKLSKILESIKEYGNDTDK